MRDYNHMDLEGFEEVASLVRQAGEGVANTGARLINYIYPLKEAVDGERRANPDRPWWEIHASTAGITLMAATEPGTYTILVNAGGFTEDDLYKAASISSDREWHRQEDERRLQARLAAIQRDY